MEPSSAFRQLPSVDRLLSDERLAPFIETCSHETVAEIVRQHLDGLRRDIGKGQDCPPYEDIVEAVIGRIESLGAVGPRPVINATGVIIHTNLGRAPLSPEAIDAMKRASEDFTNLEIDLPSGKRGSRHVHLRDLLCHLTGAEDALVVNNNASAVLLGLSAVANRKEVIVSRGQAVEIGGGFRIPDVMRQSGARLVEVGTTNRTRLSDYEAAITGRTAALLRVHSSNFRVVGFTEDVEITGLVGLGDTYDVPVFDDLGSGCLLETTRFGLGPEPTVQESIAAGTGLAFFSGDKLLGGPQAGIIVGRKTLVGKLKRHPLARAVRIDKTRLAALSATLVHYLKNEPEKKIPVWRMIACPLTEIERRAETWSRRIGERATTSAGESTVGGGSLPGSTLPTRLVMIDMRRGTRVQELARRLRLAPTPVIGRIEHSRLILDPRSVLPEEDAALLTTLQQVFAAD